MKKTNIILVNLFLIILLFFICEFFCWAMYAKNELNGVSLSSYSLKIQRFENYIKNKENIRPVSGSNYLSKPILLLGCSFTYGEGLKDNETFSYKLSKLTKRPVYNYGLRGLGLQEAIYLILKNHIQIKEPPEYIIYTYIGDHEERLLYSRIRGLEHLSFKNKEGLPIYIQNANLSNRFYSLVLLNSLINRNLPNDIKQRNTIEHFILFKNLIQKNYPKAKIIVFYYEDNTYHNYVIDKINEIGIETIKMKDLGIQSEKLPKLIDGHPAASAWDIVVPKLIKYINIQ